MRFIAIGVIVAFFAASQAVVAQAPTPTKIRVGKVELTYIEAGRGQPLILLHGGQADYRSWLSYLSRFQSHYRVIAYSRRYNYPNVNPINIKNHSAIIEAKDLERFVSKLKLKHVHLVGTSIGAYTALIYTVKHPNNVASLTMAEPAINAWVKNTPEFAEFNSRAWLPAAEAFRRGDDRRAMQLLVDIFGGEGAFDKMPAEGQAIAMANARFFKAATLSTDPTPDISKTKVRNLKMPVLIIEGENTFAMSKLIIDQLKNLLPSAEMVVIPHAGHGSPRENPQAFGNAVSSFLSRITEKRLMTGDR